MQVVARDQKASPVSKAAGGTSDAWIMPSGHADTRELHLQDDMQRDADLVYERLEQGAHLHCCSSTGLEPKVARMLVDEAALQGEDGLEKLAQWQRNGQLHVECMCKRASDTQKNPGA